MGSTDDALSASHVERVRADARAEATASMTFPDVDLDAGVVVAVPTELRGLLVCLAEETGESLQAIVLRALQEFVGHEVGPPTDAATTDG